MAMNKSRYLRKKVLDHSFGRAAFAFPSSVWLGLFSADPTDIGSLTNELTQSGYARVLLTPLLANAVLATGMISNNAEIEFATAGEDWPAITHAAVIDSSGIGTGNILYFGPAVTARIIEFGDQFKILVGQLTVSET